MKRATAALLAALTVIGGCSKTEPPSINGHWRAERVQVQSLVIPIGPELVINDHEIQVPATNLRLPVDHVERHGNNVTVQFAVGLGWTFFVESATRMYIDVPLVGKVAYTRVAAPSNAGQPAPVQQALQLTKPASGATPQGPAVEGSSATPQAPQATPHGPRVPASVAQGADAAAERVPTASPDVLARAAEAAQRNDFDTALRELDAALANKTVTAAQAAGDHRLAPLRNDIRYQALIARNP